MSIESIRNRLVLAQFEGDVIRSDGWSFIKHARADVALLLAVAEAALPILPFVTEMRESGKTSVVVNIEAIADALAALEAHE